MNMMLNIAFLYKYGINFKEHTVLETKLKDIMLTGIFVM